MKHSFFILALLFCNQLFAQQKNDTVTKQLKEVAIKFKKPTIERKIDRVIFNVESSPIASGGTVFEALTKAPGVRAANDGNISAGNKGATLYIDNKPVRLTGEELATYLQSLPADNISKIEVMTNPNSSYDAQGGAIINIISKKIKADGFNINLNSAYTRSKRNSYRGNGIFNYRKNELNVFGSFGYSDRNAERNLYTYTIYQTPDAYSHWNTNRTSLPEDNVYNYKLGVDYNVSPNQILGILVTGNNDENFAKSSGLTNVFNNHRTSPDSLLNTSQQRVGKNDQYSFNLNYKVRLDTAGQSLNLDVDYAPFRNSNRSYLDNISQLPDGSMASPVYRIVTPWTQKIGIWSAKLDYEYKLGKNLQMESGLKYTSISSENRFELFNTAGDIPVLDPSQSNFFTYTEKTPAAYTSMTASFGKWSFKGGLRTEHTQTEGYSVQLDSLNKNSYLRLFPTAFITYKLKENHEFSLSYSTRINRPGYQQLNPARSYTTPYSYQSGNPFLRPMTIYSTELSYTFRKNYTLTAGYSDVKDLFSNVTVQDNVSKTFYDTQQNLGKYQNLSLELSSTHHPFSWWEISNYAQYTRNTQASPYAGGPDLKGNFYNFRSSHSFDIDPKSGIKAELSAWLNSAVRQGSFNIGKTSDVSAGITKPVLKKQGTIRLTASDIFFKNPYTINVNYLDQRNGLYQQNDTRNFTLSFSYKLGKSVAEARKRSTASEEERQRSN
jgi:outer membrane receptor protein involved in Fe transport